MYVYAMPLRKDTQITGTLVVFHEAAYVEAQSAQIWRDALWHVVTQVLLIMLITLLVIRWTIVP